MWLWGCLSNLVLQGQYQKWFWVTGVARWGAVIWEEKLKVCHLSDIAETRCSLPRQLPHQQECRAGIKIKKIKIKIYGSEFTSKPYCSTGKGHVQIHQEMKQNKTKKGPSPSASVLFVMVRSSWDNQKSSHQWVGCSHPNHRRPPLVNMFSSTRKI